MIAKKYSSITFPTVFASRDDSDVDTNATTTDLSILKCNSAKDEDTKGSPGLDLPPMITKFEALRLMMKRTGFPSPEKVDRFYNGLRLPPRIELSMRSRVIDAGLEEYSENFEKSISKYEIGGAIGEVI